jgi:hypothetical protein
MPVIRRDANEQAGAEEMPIVGGARFKDGWLVGRAVALRPASEI